MTITGRLRHWTRADAVEVEPQGERHDTARIVQPALLGWWQHEVDASRRLPPEDREARAMDALHSWLDDLDRRAARRTSSETA